MWSGRDPCRREPQPADWCAGSAARPCTTSADPDHQQPGVMTKGIIPHLCEGMALNRCACNPSREWLPRRHLYLFSRTPFSTTTFTETYSCMPGGSCKAQHIARSLFIMVSFEMLPYKFEWFYNDTRWLQRQSPVVWWATGPRCGSGSEHPRCRSSGGCEARGGPSAWGRCHRVSGLQISLYKNCAAVQQFTPYWNRLHITCDLSCSYEPYSCYTSDLHSSDIFWYSW